MPVTLAIVFLLEGFHFSLSLALGLVVKQKALFLALMMKQIGSYTAGPK